MAERVLTQRELPFGLLILVENGRGLEIAIEDLRGSGWFYRVNFPDVLDYKAFELVETAEDEQDVNTILREWGPWEVWDDYMVWSSEVENGAA